MRFEELIKRRYLVQGNISSVDDLFTKVNKMVQEAPSSNEEVDMITRRYESLVAVKNFFIDNLQHEIHRREPVSVQQVTFEY